MDTQHSRQTTQAWRDVLRREGYEHADSAGQFLRFSRMWRKILSHTGFSSGTSAARRVFEVGFGGGKHLIPFACAGWHASGVDCSSDVADRAHVFQAHAESLVGHELSVRFEVGDFFDYQTDDLYDLVFHVGVIEHFLDDAERLIFLRKMFAITAPGGFVVSIVPSGAHPWRSAMKAQRLGGYDIPEIDYTRQRMEQEFADCGARNILILPHNIFSYRRMRPSLFNTALYYFFQLIPEFFLPSSFLFRHAGTIVGIARKSG